MSKTTVKEKIGVVRFLQLNPQPDWVASLAKSMYASKVMTEKEWQDAIISLTNKKVGG